VKETNKNQIILICRLRVVRTFYVYYVSLTLTSVHTKNKGDVRKIGYDDSRHKVSDVFDSVYLIIW